MQKIFFVSVLLFAFSTALNAQQDAKSSFAGRIAQKMKDSLSLDKKQQQQVYEINVSIADQKDALRKQYAAGSDSLRIHTQKVENSRDASYRAVLTEDQYIWYQQKKRNLINNN